jgi:predicted transcriptional regulator
MQNRQKDEMVRDILTVSNGGATISQIMFKAYTSHSQAKSYLGELIQSAFLEYDPLDRKYRTTSKGLEYLQAADRMAEMLTINTRRSVANKRSAEAYQF